MNYFIIIIVIIIFIFVVWYVLKALVGVLVSPEKSGFAYLKQQLNLKNVDSSRLPDAVLSDVVEYYVLYTAAMASREKGYELHWKSKMVDFLDFEALAIKEILDGKRSAVLTNSRAWKALVEHGLVQAKFTFEEFS